MNKFLGKQGACQWGQDQFTPRMIRKSSIQSKSEGAKYFQTSTVFGALAITSILSLSGCQAGKNTQQATTEVQVYTIKEQLFKREATYQSTLVAILEIPMSPEIDGRIIAMPMREGAYVKAGTLLYRLDQLPIEGQANAELAIARNARVNSERYLIANFSGAVSQKESDDYRASAKASNEIFKSRKATLAYKQVRAPINGQLGAINNKLGDYVKTGTPVTTLVDNSRLWVAMDIPAELAHEARLGQLVGLKAPGLKGRQVYGRVTFIAPALDLTTQTLMLRATFNNPDQVLRHNQRVEAKLIFGSGKELSIPENATFLQAGQSFAYVAAPKQGSVSTLKLTPIKVGVSQNNMYPIVSGLKTGDKVVIGNLSSLSNGDTVKIAGER
jgi:RND family efflux transporter MFP subunit